MRKYGICLPGVLQSEPVKSLLQLQDPSVKQVPCPLHVVAGLQALQKSKEIVWIAIKTYN